jgi:2-polyprenyl-3-methyl-5-hydroxy-6-metoxy-1,4-benzoquinol methylase
MTPTVTVDHEGTVTGNTYDKYGTTNPVARRLQAGFERTLEELFAKAAPTTLLDVGCGEGVLTHQWAQKPAMQRIVGLDLDDPQLHEAWKGRQHPCLQYVVMKAENLPFADGEFEVATAIEVLEHVPDPEHTVSEMARCASEYLLVSVPREPLWRGLNLVRGAYVKDLGNTPGHLNHWSKRSFTSLLGRYGTVVEARSPFPWTMLLVRVGA